MTAILAEAGRLPNPDFDSSSQYVRPMSSPATWQLQPEINIGEVVGWIFIHEEKGERMKS